MSTLMMIRIRGRARAALLVLLACALCLAFGSACDRGADQGGTTDTTEGGNGGGDADTVADAGDAGDAAAEEEGPVGGTPEPHGAAIIDELRAAAERAAVVVPDPNELLMTVSAFAEGVSVDWSAHAADPEAGVPSDEVDAAILTGRRMARFFMAVQGEDTDQARTLAERILEGADRLGVGSQAREESAAVVSALADGNWAGVRSAMTDVSAAINAELNERPASDRVGSLMAYGAWQESLVVASAIAAENYSERRAGALRQHGLARYFRTTLSSLEGAAGSREDVQQALPLLESLASAMRTDTASVPSEENVGAIRDTAAQLRTLL